MTKKDFFSILLFVLGLILAVLVFRAYGEQIRLQWDPVDGVDGYYLFQAIRAQNPDTGQAEHVFDFSSPITTQEFPDGKVPQDITQLSVDLPGEAGADTKYMFVARAFRGDEQSENSNEVAYVVSLVPPFAPAELSGNYDKTAGMIHVSWSQPADEFEWRAIDHWSVHYRVADGEWQPVGQVDAGHELSMETTFDAVSEGEQANVDFVVVAHRRSGVYSPDSEILTLDIDRRDVPPVQKLRINIEFPVT